MFLGYSKPSEQDSGDPSKQVPDLLNTTNELQAISFENLYDEFNYSPTNLLNTNYITQMSTPVETEPPPKYAAVTEEQFEIANRLKDYAAVATENIPLQLSYNIGTENVEDGKEGETFIENIKVELGENSLITEFENAGINLCDLGNPSENISYNPAFNSNEEVKISSPKVKIIDVQNITPSNPLTTSNSKMSVNPESVSLVKQIFNPEALQMSLVCDDEIPSAWDDVLTYETNANQMNMFKENVNENPLTAVPTTIQSYINLPLIPISASVDINNDLINSTNLIQDSSFTVAESGNNNLLKKVTAEFEICSCNDCHCTSYENCQSCHRNESTSKDQQVSFSHITTNNPSIIIPSSAPTISNQSSCCDTKNISSNCSLNVSLKSSCCSNSTCSTSNIPDHHSCCTSTLNSTGCSSNNPIQLSCKRSQKNVSAPGKCNSMSSTPLITKSIMSLDSTPKQPIKNSCSGINTAIQLIQASNPDCSKKGDDCCVVICLKTMDQLKQMLSLASGCNNFQNFSLGCVPADLCGVPK